MIASAFPNHEAAESEPRQRSIIARWNTIAHPASRAGGPRPSGAAPRHSACAVQTPCKRILGVDAGRGAVGSAGPGHGVCDVPAVVEVGDGRLELGSNAVRGEKALDRADERVFPPRGRLVTGGGENIAEQDHVGGDRQLGHHPSQARDRGRIPALGGIDPGQAGFAWT